ncbi:hypothetical protein D3C85_1653540 [compost metagenome]
MLRWLDGPHRYGIGRTIRTTDRVRPYRYRIRHTDLSTICDGLAGAARDLGRPGTDLSASVEQCREQPQRNIIDAAGFGAYTTAGLGDPVRFTCSSTGRTSRFAAAG